MALRSSMCFWISVHCDDCAKAGAVSAASAGAAIPAASPTRARRDASAGRERDRKRRDNGLILRSRANSRIFVNGSVMPCQARTVAGPIVLVVGLVQTREQASTSLSTRDCGGFRSGPTSAKAALNSAREDRFGVLRLPRAPPLFG